MSRPRAITAIVVLLLAGVVSVATARPNKIPRVGAAQAQRPGGPHGQRAQRIGQSPTRPGKAAHISPYWRAEHRIVRQQHELGRLGREVRRLRYLRRRNQHVRLLQKRALRANSVGGSAYAIRLASSAFGVSEGEMRSVAGCETGGTFSPTAYNAGSGAAGLFQFLDGTWANQGLAGFSVYDAVANALAAARIVAREGWAQWECKP